MAVQAAGGLVGICFAYFFARFFTVRGTVVLAAPAFTLLAWTLLHAGLSTLTTVPAGVAPVVRDAPPHVEATVRGGFLFLLNHSDTDTATIPAAGVDLLTGSVVDGAVALGPLGVAVIEARS